MSMETISETLQVIDTSMHTRLAGVNRLTEIKANAAWLKKRGIIHVPGHQEQPKTREVTISLAQKKSIERRRKLQRTRHQEIYSYLHEHPGLTARQVAQALFPLQSKRPHQTARHHLMIMRDKGLIRIEKEGLRYVYYAIQR